ncbi:MAG: hypothetical protein KAV00_07195 [Phycisphaerae bacterium]|nr:hypothetical protein [Phycisphaerae bacterium]
MIVIDQRQAPGPRVILNAIADSCRDMGFEVVRWYADSITPFPACDKCILWHSPHPKYRRAIEQIIKAKTPVLYVQDGWFPKGPTFQLNTIGANGTSSWARKPLRVKRGKYLTVRKGDLLVALQEGLYIESNDFSPWFSSSLDLIRHLITHSHLPLRFRLHPRNPPTTPMRAIVEAAGYGWDTSPTFADAMKGACAVATIHSTCGLEAIAAGLPALCYGNAVYRHAGAVWPMTDSPLQTWTRTSQLAAGHCDLDNASQRAIIRRIYRHQHTVDDLPGCLMPFIKRHVHTQ